MGFEYKEKKLIYVSAPDMMYCMQTSKSLYVPPTERKEGDKIMSGNSKKNIHSCKLIVLK